MIPHKLRLQNFMCYRDEQSLDFSGIHLACLAGENGHGKSALLDAMTWALWGRSRARRDDELIALGEMEMSVDLEFGLGSQRYRVLRQRSKKGRGQSDLHLYIWNATGEGDWRLLDEGNLLDRQQQIIRLLRLDYETFTNSAFLLQGRADSFTTKAPAERKQVLADILGLSRYDQYEQRARELAQDRKERTLKIDGELRAIDGELARRTEFETQLEQARQIVADAAEQMQAAEKVCNDARAAVQELRGSAQQLNDVDRNIARAERDLTEERSQLRALEARVKGFEAILARRDEIEAGWQRLEAARQADARWNDSFRAHSGLQEQQAAAQRVVDRARAELEAERRSLGVRHAELGRRVAEVDRHKTSLADAQAALQRFEEMQVQREAHVGALRELGERAAALRASLERIKGDGQTVNAKADVLETAEAAVCPLCQQPLSPEHRRQVEADLRIEHETLAQQYRAGNLELKALGERKTVLEAEERALAVELTGRDGRHRQAVAAEAAIAEAVAAEQEQEAVAAEIAAVEERLAKGAYAEEARARLAELQVQIAENGYDAAEHQATRDAVRASASFDAEYHRQLAPAVDGVVEARRQAEALAGQIARREADLAEDRAQRETLAAAVRQLPAREAEMRQAIARADEVASVERRARQQEGGAMQQLAALDAQAGRRDQLRTALDTLLSEQGLYNELREAFGKKGIQAMIIESAIPEVEAETNRLLNRMSEGRMSVRLETQREKVTGGVMETLDIIISDERGSRSYEMYSGGEAFRANLALRIAISKLLARRAGAQLQTLVIDEGFGSQDSTGRALVVEAINSIQHDFERILVITHIDELKDLFPARIDVVKTPTGSRVSIT